MFCDVEKSGIQRILEESLSGHRLIVPCLNFQIDKLSEYKAIIKFIVSNTDNACTGLASLFSRYDVIPCFEIE